MPASRVPPRAAAPRSESQRGQSITEFALVAPIVLFLLFGALELSLLFYVMSSARYASGDGAREAAQLGNSASTDTTTIQLIRTGPFGTNTLASVSEIDIYRLTQSGGGQLTVDNSHYNKYRLDGSNIGTLTWPSTSRNVKLGQSDFLGLTIRYSYSWKTGRMLSASAVQLTQTSYVRLEPQTY
jgi:Flp pilus assembly protein TadG